MTNRFFTPFEQFLDDVGQPYSGGKLYFYLTNTDTLQNTYSNSTLTIANTNPIVLDSAGRPEVSIFLAQAAYKVVLKDSDDVQIWTADPVWSSDYSTVAQFQVYSGNPNGSVAGTAGTQGGLPSSVLFNPVTSILYVCTTTGTASTAVWTAINSPTTNTFVPVPTGYLTLTSSTPIITTDVAAATAVYYTPFTGDTCPIYNGTAFATTQFTELTLTLSASQAANTIYDVFMFNNSGTATIAVGPAWTTSTAGSGNRGTGAGTTQLSRVNGIWVNTVQMTARNGATTYTVSANVGTYLGSILIDGSAGQVTCHRSLGQNRVWGVWNCYNRTPTGLMVQDATASWTYNTNTWRASNSSSNNKMTVLYGLQEEMVQLEFSQLLQGSTNGSYGQVSFGINSITAPTQLKFGQQSNFNTTFRVEVCASYLYMPALGASTITCLERAEGLGGNPTTFVGGTNMGMIGTWRA